MSTFPLPVELQGKGRVEGRFVLIVADTASDEDAFPEAKASAGTVRFNPTVTLQTTTDYYAFVGHEAHTFSVDAEGIMQDAQNTGGAWLPEGTYTVSYNLAGLSIPSHLIEVDTDNTLSNPLILSEASPPGPPPTPTSIYVEIPRGATEGEFLAWDNGLQWIAPPSLDTTNLVKTDDARLTDARTPKAHTHPIGDVAGLQAGLDGKAPTSHTHTMANVTGLTDALAGKANASHTHDMASIVGLSEALNARVLTSSGVVVTNHGSNSSVSRPANAALVIWRGTATPNNATNYDIWIGW